MKKCFNIANNQVVITDNISNGLYEYEFYSYGTFIARYRSMRGVNGKVEDSLQLSEYYDYSRTTSKYLKIFLNDYCDFYYDNTNELRKYIKIGKKDNVIIKVID